MSVTNIFYEQQVSVQIQECFHYDPASQLYCHLMSIRLNRINLLKTLNNSVNVSPDHSPTHQPISFLRGDARKEGFIPPINNPYARKFTVRRVNASQDKRNYSVGRSGILPKDPQIIRTIADTIDAKVNPHFRMHTEKVRTQPNRISEKKSLQTIDNQEAISKLQQKSPHSRPSVEKDNFGGLTKFETQQISQYEVYFIGRRRIQGAKDFTSSTCDAKVEIGDSVAYRYEVVATLGHGSFGQVFKVFDHRKQQFVALKVIRNELKFNRQAKIEIKILENVIINDPKFKANIVQLKHAFFFRGHACLVFQLLHINLYEWLRLNKFVGMPLDMIRRITIQALQSLQFFEKFQIIHCDLKPENIMFKQEQKTGIKIIDVGSGCYSPDQLYTYIQSRFYRAPQIILGMTYSPAIDIWSLGCILMQLYLGYPLFPGESEAEQMLMIMELLGVPPEGFLALGSRSKKFFDGNLPRIKPNSKGKTRKPNTRSLDRLLQDCNDKLFVQFVRGFLHWVPEERIRPKEALLHPWIMEGLPEEILKQHIHSVKKEGY